MERRLWPRAALRAKVEVNAPGVSRTISSGAYLRNISKHGFAFATEDALVKGGRYNFTIDTFDLRLKLTARVMHVRLESTYYLIGARVEKLSLTQRSRLNHVLAPLFKGWSTRYLVQSLGIGLGVLTVLKFGFLADWIVAGGLAGATAIVIYILLPF